MSIALIFNQKPTEEWQLKLQELLPETKVEVYPNISVSEEEFLDKKNYKHINLLFLSNFLEEKGINVFFEAIREINKRGILINVKIAGNKVANNNIDNYLKELTFRK